MPTLPHPLSRRRKNGYRLRAVFLIAIGMAFMPQAVPAQDVRVTEFMALNSTGERDEDGDFSAWIELWNPSPTAKVSLTDWKLTHGLATWTFPTVEIMAREYMIIWASAKDRRNATAPLHTNFVLSSNGDLKLARPDGTVTSQYLAYPIQQPNISFGRDIAVPALTGSYSDPSPGEPNNYDGAGVAKKVRFSVASKAFQKSLSVQLSQTEPLTGAVIRYTTDGSVPTDRSPAYSKKLSIKQTQVVRARIFKSGLLPGQTESQGYLLLSGTSQSFQSRIPIVVLSSFGRSIPAEPKIPAFMWIFEPVAGGFARLTNVPTIAVRAAIDKRGFSSFNNPKYNLNLETRRAFDDEELDIPLLGMPDHADWVLHAPYILDPALIRNPFVYGLSNLIGRYAARTRMAEVFVDTDGGPLTSAGTSNYFGVYNAMERIRRGRNRVNIKKLDPFDNDPVKITGGYIVKVDRRDPGEVGFTTAHEGSFVFYRPDEEDMTSPQRAPQSNYIRTFLNDFDNACFAGGDGYAEYLDIPAAIDHHLINTWAFNIDALRLSTYLHKDRGGKLVYGPVWDFDRAICSNDGRDSNPTTWRSISGEDTDFFNYTWWKQLFSDIDFYQRYIDRWSELRRNGAFRPATVNSLIDSLNAAIGDEALARDSARWRQAKRSWTSPFTGQTLPVGQPAEIQRMKDWLQQRANFIDSQFVGPVTILPASGPVGSGTLVTMTASGGATIYYSLDGTDPRPPGGGTPNAALVYEGPLTIDPPATFRARAYNPTWVALTGPNNPPLVSKWSAATAADFTSAP